MDKKALSLPILLSFVVGQMIGTGIYILPASLAAYGTVSLLAWLLTSAGSLFLALTFANLSKRFPKTGGPYIYCKQAFGTLTGMIVAYIYWFSYLLSVAAVAIASIAYFGFIFPELNANTPVYNPYLAIGLEIASVWIFTMINLVGVHTAGVVQLFMTIIKVSPLLLISFVGLSYIHVGNLVNYTFTQQVDFTAISSASALIFWAFTGLESATVPAENTQGYRDIYKATIYGTVITAAIYILSTFVLMGMIPVTELKSSQFPFAQAGTMLFGPKAALVITICAIIAGLGVMNVLVLNQGLIVFAAARDGLFPRIFKKLSKHDVPVAAQILSSSIITILLIATIRPTLLKQFDYVALLAVLLTLITYLVAMLAELKFLYQSKKSFRKILVSKSLYITLLAVVYSAWTISTFNFNMQVFGLIIMLICIPFYHFRIKK